MRLKRSDRNKLTRENYCIPTTNLRSTTKKMILFAQEFYRDNNEYPSFYPEHYCKIPNSVFADYEHYTDEWAENHYRNCMENLGLNMRFFSSLNQNDFEKYLLSFVKRNRFKEIDDLKTVLGVEGIYILVLDEYKQVYIGVSSDIKRRILQHWSSKKEFDRLIFGGKEQSILSIDSFGALDTTRIFYKPCGWWEKDKTEEKYVSSFKNIYRLNRVSGGINAEEDETIRNLALLANTQKRELK